MDDFTNQIQSDELASYEPTQADWEEYHAWLEEQEAVLPEPEPEEYQWTEEAIAWEEDQRWDNIYFGDNSEGFFDGEEWG